MRDYSLDFRICTQKNCELSVNCSGDLLKVEHLFFLVLGNLLPFLYMLMFVQNTI